MQMRLTINLGTAFVLYRTYRVQGYALYNDLRMCLNYTLKYSCEWQNKHTGFRHKPYFF